MKILIFVLVSILFLNVDGLKVICVNSDLGIIMNLDCEHLQIYKLNHPLCQKNKEIIEVDPHKNILRFSHQFEGVNFDYITEMQLKYLPNLKETVSEICPSKIQNKFLNKLGESPLFQGLDDVTVSLWNADGMEGNHGLYQNYYQHAPKVHTFTFDSEPNMTFKDLNKYFGVFNDSANYYVHSAKIYDQDCGEIAEDIVQVDNIMAQENLYTHYIDLVLLLLYDPFNYQGPKVTEYHQVLEFCLKNDVNNKTQHLIMDRTAGSDGDQKLRFFNSKINFYYNGEGDGCALNSTKWADYKAGVCQEKPEEIRCLVSSRNSTNMAYPISKVVKLGTDFLLKFRKFNGLFNCQHFATNAWNYMTDDTLDYRNYNVMLMHSRRSGLEPYTPFVEDI